MKTLKTLIFILFALAVIWIDVPENLPFSFFKTHLGLDLRGGSHLVFNTDVSKLKKEDVADALNSARDIIERRVNFFGVSEPSVQTLQSGTKYRIIVDLPGIDKVADAVKLIGRTAQLSFNEEAEEKKVSTTSSILERLTKNTGMNGAHIKKASVRFDSQTGKPQVALDFTKEGADFFAKVTQKNVGKPVAIFLDNFLLSAPVVQQPILDGNAVITGDFTIEEAKQLAISINSGSLPIPIQLVEQRNIGPTLGAAEIRKSIFAGTVGLFAVLGFMIMYYGKLGLVATIALIIYGFISLAIFRLIPVVLTLPGVAGFILSIGMAVDSNILIFERIKEELRKNKPFDIAVRFGFGRAIDAIKDANITTITVALILFNPLNWDFLPQFGLVRGFALTLLVGVATSLFTGVVITRRLIEIFYKNKTL